MKTTGIEPRPLLISAPSTSFPLPGHLYGSKYELNLQNYGKGENLRDCVTKRMRLMRPIAPPPHPILLPKRRFQCT
jgi:hypothetical protein